MKDIIGAISVIVVSILIIAFISIVIYSNIWGKLNKKSTSEELAKTMRKEHKKSNYPLLNGISILLNVLAWIYGISLTLCIFGALSIKPENYESYKNMREILAIFNPNSASLELSVDETMITLVLTMAIQGLIGILILTGSAQFIKVILKIEQNTRN